MVPAGNDDDDVTFLGFGAAFSRSAAVMTSSSSWARPALLRSEESIGRDGGQVCPLLNKVDRGVHVRARVQNRSDVPGKYAVLGLDAARHMDVGLPRIRRGPWSYS